ncbi:MAG TPA: helix-turn-helix domain-containing protein [Tepidisphaeraceae bacterium]|jgi:hypothetical protein|nr:helix-turn-helix domain-containing protein [Tepidisphaeraceae bacterium]
MFSDADSIHLADLLAAIYARHGRYDSVFQQMSDDQLEQLAAKSDRATFFRNDAWQFIAAEVGKRSGLSERRLADFAGMVKLGVIGEGVRDVAALVAKLHGEGFTELLMVRLRADYPGEVAAMHLPVPMPPRSAGAGNVAASAGRFSSPLASDLLTVAEAAVASKVDAKTIHRLIRDGRLNAIPYGSGMKRKNYRIKRGDLAEVRPDAVADAQAPGVSKRPRPLRQPAASSACDFLPRVR